jgi:hypothetical protein
MKGFVSFLKRYYSALLLVAAGLITAIYAIQAVTGVPGFIGFCVGALALIIGIVIIIY